jgi:hypothetical protein
VRATPGRPDRPSRLGWLGGPGRLDRLDASFGSDRLGWLGGPGRLDRLDASFGSDRLGWLLVVGLAVYVLVAVIDWRVPDAGGVPFGPLWAGLATVGIVGARLLRGRWEPLVALAACGSLAMLLTDLTQFHGQVLRDLGIYLKAGEHFAAGAPAYLSQPMTTQPVDLTNYPFVYPPPTLPVFVALAALPRPLVEVTWLVGSVAAALGGLRLLGSPWRWAVAALVWPPFFQGIYVGNVSVLLFALLAAAPWLGGGLLLGAILKPYSAVASLWLVRERRFRALGAGGAAVAVVGLATLPVVGLGVWRDWLEGLRYYAESGALLPTRLIALGLSAYVPWVAAALASVAVVAWAWLGRGREGLARFGVATVVTSPSVFAHGFLLALPAFLGLRRPWLWVALGITSVAPGLGWWMTIVLVVGATFLPGLRRETGGPWSRPADADDAAVPADADRLDVVHPAARANLADPAGPTIRP